MCFIKKYWKILFTLVLGIIFILIPFNNIILDGIYTPFLKSESVRGGGLEAFVFILVTLFFMHIYKEKAHIILISFSCLYLSMSAVIIPVIAVGIYFEALCFIGSSFISIEKTEHSDNIPLNYITGVAVWGAMAIIASLLHLGTINKLRILTLLLCFICFTFSYRKQYKPICLRLINFLIKGNGNFKFSILIVVITFLFLILFAKTNYAIESDSIHYGLKPELTLVGENSFYDYLGLTFFVNYYPKLWELLYLPISNLGDYSFLLSANIYNLIIIVCILYQVLDKLFKKASREENLFISAIIISTPAIANISVTTKPDILGLLLFLFAFSRLINWLESKEIKEFTIAMIALMMSTGTKLTYLLWGGIIFLFFVAIFTLYYLKHKGLFKDLKKLSIFDFLFIVFGIILTIGVHLRTFFLTGYPTYPTAINFYKKIGFRAKNYALVGSIENTVNIIAGSLKETLIQFLKRFYNVFFAPEAYPTLIILWFSNLFLLLIVICALYGIFHKIIIKKEDRQLLFLYIIMYCVFSYFMLYCLGFNDGNYYIAPVVIGIVLGCYFVRKYSNIFGNVVSKRILMSIFIVYLTLQYIIMFVSSPSWSLGTHAFNGEVIKNNFDSKEYNKSAFLYHGCNKIAEYIDMNPVQGKLLISEGIEMSVAYRLNAAVDGYTYIKHHIKSYRGVDNYDVFKDYIRDTHVRGIVIANEDESNLSEYALQYATENNITPAVIDEKAVLYIF